MKVYIYKVRSQNTFHATILYLIFTYLDAHVWISFPILTSELQMLLTASWSHVRVPGRDEWKPSRSALYQLSSLHSPQIKIWKKLCKVDWNKLLLILLKGSNNLLAFENHSNFYSKFTTEREEMSLTAQVLDDRWQIMRISCLWGNGLTCCWLQSFPGPKQQYTGPKITFLLISYEQDQV